MFVIILRLLGLLGADLQLPHHAQETPALADLSQIIFPLIKNPMLSMTSIIRRSRILNSMFLS